MTETVTQEPAVPATEDKTAKRGFGTLKLTDPQKMHDVASRGGKAAHAKGTAHEFTSDEAKAAGAKGGASVSRDRDHMSRIGRKGGLATVAKKKQLDETLNAPVLSL